MIQNDDDTENDTEKKNDTEKMIQRNDTEK